LKPNINFSTFIYKMEYCPHYQKPLISLAQF
jgi:hypothetical protein